MASSVPEGVGKVGASGMRELPAELPSPKRIKLQAVGDTGMSVLQMAMRMLQSEEDVANLDDLAGFDSSPGSPWSGDPPAYIA